MKPILAFVLLAACSHNPLDPGAGNNVGTGTSTLSVDGNAIAHPNIPNSGNGNDFVTDFSVRVQLNGQTVTTGSVTLRSLSGPVSLVFNSNENRWTGTGNGYEGAYQLDVVSGADKVEGVIVDGPDIQVFTAPMAGATLDSTIANMATWDRVDAAQQASFDIHDGNIDRLTITDSGSFSIPIGALKAEKDQTRSNTLELTRTNEVAPAGAVAGSTFEVGVSQELDVLVAPNPAL